MKKIILIQRYQPSSIFWGNMVINNKVTGLSVEEVLKKYQGFEGELIEYFPIERIFDELNEIINQFSDEIKSTDNLMFYVHSDRNDGVSLAIKDQFKFVGFDVGVCDKKKTIFSSIFNEILFGHLNDLIIFNDFLNNNFLFPDKQIAEAYVNLHNELSKQGRGVEDHEVMTIYELWKFQ